MRETEYKSRLIKKAKEHGWTIYLVNANVRGVPDIEMFHERYPGKTIRLEAKRAGCTIIHHQERMIAKIRASKQHAFVIGTKSNRISKLSITKPIIT